MSRSPGQFVRRVQFRWTMQRALDGALLFLSGTTLLGLPIIWATHASMSSLLAAGLISGLAGAAATLIRRPGFLQVAAQVDRQLQLHDLLSSALRAASAVDLQFTQIIRAQAAAACVRHRPGEIVIPHGSASMRLGKIVLIAIAANVAWLGQPARSIDRQPAAVGAITPVILSTSLQSHQGDLTAESPVVKLAESIEASKATSESNGSSSASKSSSRRADNTGGTFAQTIDAHAERLAAPTGISGKGGDVGETSARVLAAQLPIPPSSKVSRKTFPVESAGDTAAAAPPEDRDLIRAYFSAPSH